MSADVTLLTIGSEEKTVCRTGEELISYPAGSAGRWHGRLSWLFGQALLNTPPQSSWIQILAEMERLTQTQAWEQPLMFCGQPTQRFGLAMLQKE